MVMTRELDLTLNIILLAFYVVLVAIGVYCYYFHPKDEDDD